MGDGGRGESRKEEHERGRKGETEDAHCSMVIRLVRLALERGEKEGMAADRKFPTILWRGESTYKAIFVRGHGRRRKSRK